MQGINEDIRSEVIFKYFLPDHKNDVWIHTNGYKLWSTLHDIDQKCRWITKNEKDDDSASLVCKLADEIRELIRINVDLDEVL